MAQPNSFQNAVQDLEQEKKMVAALKRLSIGNMMSYDPDLPPGTFEDQIYPQSNIFPEESIDDNVTVRVSLQKSPSSKSSKSLPPTPTKSEPHTPNKLSTSPIRRQNSISPIKRNSIYDSSSIVTTDSNDIFFDASDDQILDSSNLIWVPANMHPQINPESFKSLVQNQVEEILERKLSRKSSKKSSLSRNSSIKDPQEEEYELNDLNKTHSNNERSNNNQKRESWYNKRISNPSLRELTNELEQLSKLAGMDKSDAVTLARTLSSNSLGYTDVERLAIDELNDSQTSPPRNNTLQIQQLLQHQFDQSANIGPEPFEEEKEELSPPADEINRPVEFSLRRSRRTDYRKKEATMPKSIQPHTPTRKFNRDSQLLFSYKKPIDKQKNALDLNLNSFSSNPYPTASTTLDFDRLKNKSRSKQHVPSSKTKSHNNYYKSKHHQQNIPSASNTNIDDYMLDYNSTPTKHHHRSRSKPKSKPALPQSSVPYRAAPQSIAPQIMQQLPQQNRAPSPKQNLPKSQQLHQNLDMLRSEINEFKESLNKETTSTTQPLKNQDLSFDLSYQDLSIQDELGIDQEIMQELSKDVEHKDILPDLDLVDTELDFDSEDDSDTKPEPKSSHFSKKESKVNTKMFNKDPNLEIIDSTNYKDNTDSARGNEIKHIKKKKSWGWLRERSSSLSSIDTNNLPPTPNKVPVRSLSNPEPQSNDQSKENVITKLFKKKRNNSSSNSLHSVESNNSGVTLDYESDNHERSVKKKTSGLFKKRSKAKLTESNNVKHSPITIVEINNEDKENIVSEPETTKIEEPEVTVQHDDILVDTPTELDLTPVKESTPEPVVQVESEPEPEMSTQRERKKKKKIEVAPVEENDDKEKIDIQEKLKKSIKRTSKPNQPIEFTDSAFGFPLPPPSQSTLVMLDYRFPVHVERAIYRLSHLKLANPKRSLREQVLLSNFMYAYLNLVDHTLHLEQQNVEEEQEQEVFGQNEVLEDDGLSKDYDDDEHILISN